MADAGDVDAKFVIETWQTERGWSARSGWWGIEAEGGETKDHAVNEVAGAVLIALGQRVRPPRSVLLIVCERDREPQDG